MFAVDYIIFSDAQIENWERYLKDMDVIRGEEII